jgi:Na+/H+ antiporter NhaD/arsenite permease-like protein
VHMGPTVAISFVVSLLLLKLLFRKDLKASVQNPEQLMREDEAVYLKDKNLLKKSMVVLIGVIVLFVLHSSLPLEPSVIAIGGAAVLLVITGQVLKEYFMKLIGLLCYFLQGFS